MLISPNEKPLLSADPRNRTFVSAAAVAEPWAEVAFSGCQWRLNLSEILVARILGEVAVAGALRWVAEPSRIPGDAEGHRFVICEQVRWA